LFENNDTDNDNDVQLPWTPYVATRGVLTHLENTKNHFRPGLRPGPRWGSSRRSPRPPSRLGYPSSFPTPRRLRRLDSRRLRRLATRFEHEQGPWHQLRINLSNWQCQHKCPLTSRTKCRYTPIGNTDREVLLLEIPAKKFSHWDGQKSYPIENIDREVLLLEIQAKKFSYW